MRHRRFTHRFRRIAPATRALAAIVACSVPRLLHAQTTPSILPAAIPAYRTPAIALVQPAIGGTVPQDKPVVVFRFSQGEPDDPLDLRSFSVAVDGADVSTGFQIAGEDAWGPLVLGSNAPPIAAGAHQIAARICSQRGACGSASAVVIAAPVGAQVVDPSAPSRRGKVLDFLIKATRKLLTQ